MEYTLLLTKNQLEMIRLKSQVQGFKTMSAFARERLLKNHVDFERKVRKIHERIIGKNGDEQKSKDKNNTNTKPAHPAKG